MTRLPGRLAHRAAAALALAAALPAAAYLLPATAILRRLGERRAALNLDALEVTGTLQAEGPAADRLAAAGLPRGPGGQVAVPARVLVKVPGRCRLELAPAGVPDAQRPFVAVKDGKIAAAGGLDAIPAAVATVRAACALLAVPTTGDASEAYAAALARRGVAVGETALARFDGRIAWVLGARPSARPGPLAYVDKDGYQPLRLVALDSGALEDVRLLGWGSPTGGDWFPRAVEVLEGDQLRLRFNTEKATANPKIPDALF